MSESGWTIPGDWDGETWQCIQLQWPRSANYRLLLVSMMFMLARGREYDRETGNIKDAVAIGWQIFDKNVPLIFCNGDVPATIEYRGGSLIVMDGDDMGQVVTDVTLNELGQLIIHHGKCCTVNLGVLSQITGEVEVPTDPAFPPEDPDPPELPTYTKCGQALELIERMELLGRAAWNSRDEPWNIRSNMINANPGYSISGAAVSELLIIMIGMSAIEAVVDSDIFDASFLAAWACDLRDRLGNGAEGLTEGQFFSHSQFPLNYALFSENPDLGTVFDVYVAQFWDFIARRILGRERSNSIMLDGLFNTAAVCDCDGGGAAGGHDWELVYNFLPNDQAWVQVDGGGWVINVGWQGTNNWGGSGSFGHWRTPSIDEISGAITYVEVQYTFVDTGGLRSTNSIFIEQTDFVDAVLMTTAQMLAAYSGGASLWTGNQIYSVAPGKGFHLHVALGIEANGAVRHEITRVTVRGTGDAIGVVV